MAGEILGVAVGSGARWISLSPNGLITIAAVWPEGNFGGPVRCCFDEDRRRRGEAGSELVPKWEARGYTPCICQRVRKLLGIRGLWEIPKTGVRRRLIGKDLLEGVGRSWNEIHEEA